MTVDLAYAFDSARQAGLSAAAELLVRSAIVRSMSGVPIQFPDGIDASGSGKTFSIPPSYAGEDISSMWEDFIGEANEVGGTILVPNVDEPFIVPKVNIGAAGSYKVPHILGEYFSGHYRDATGYGSKIKLKDGEDGTLFTVAASDDEDVGPGPFILENLLIDYNSSNQSGTAYCVDFSNHTATSNSQRSGFFRRCFIRNVRTSGIRSGTRRNAGVMEQVVVETCGASALQMGSCSDWRGQNCDFGSVVGATVQDSGADSVFFNQCNFYSAGTHNYKGDLAAGDHYFLNCSFDRAERNGVDINTTDDDPWVFTNCRWGLNGAATNDTYADFNIGANNTLVAAINCPILANSASNKPRYTFNVAAGGSIMFVGPQIPSSAYVTAVANDLTRVFGLRGPRPTITGSKGANAALTDLLTKLAAMGLITDGTS